MHNSDEEIEANAKLRPQDVPVKHLDGCINRSVGHSGPCEVDPVDEDDDDDVLTEDEQRELAEMKRCPFCKDSTSFMGKKIKYDPHLKTQVAEPLKPVVDGHVIVFQTDAHITRERAGTIHFERLMTAALNYIHWMGKNSFRNGPDFNIIMNVGTNAGQTIEHLHLHIVPRAAYDGLKMPWTPEPTGAEAKSYYDGYKQAKEDYSGTWQAGYESGSQATNELLRQGHARELEQAAQQAEVDRSRSAAAAFKLGKEAGMREALNEPGKHTTGMAEDVKNAVDKVNADEGGYQPEMPWIGMTDVKKVEMGRDEDGNPVVLVTYKDGNASWFDPGEWERLVEEASHGKVIRREQVGPHTFVTPEHHTPWGVTSGHSFYELPPGVTRARMQHDDRKNVVIVVTTEAGEQVVTPDEYARGEFLVPNGGIMVELASIIPDHLMPHGFVDLATKEGPATDEELDMDAGDVFTMPERPIKPGPLTPPNFGTELRPTDVSDPLGDGIKAAKAIDGMSYNETAAAAAASAGIDLQETMTGEPMDDAERADFHEKVRIERGLDPNALHRQPREDEGEEAPKPSYKEAMNAVAAFANGYVDQMREAMTDVGRRLHQGLEEARAAMTQDAFVLNTPNPAAQAVQAQEMAIKAAGGEAKWATIPQTAQRVQIAKHLLDLRRQKEPIITGATVRTSNVNPVNLSAEEARIVADKDGVKWEGVNAATTPFTYIAGVRDQMLTAIADAADRNSKSFADVRMRLDGLEQYRGNHARFMRDNAKRIARLERQVYLLELQLRRSARKAKSGKGKAKKGKGRG